MVPGDANLASQISRQVRAHVQHAVPDSAVYIGVVLLEIMPDGVAFVLGIDGVDHAQEDAADAHHHGQIILHVALQPLLGHIAGKLDGVDRDR